VHDFSNHRIAKLENRMQFWDLRSTSINNTFVIHLEVKQCASPDATMTRPLSLWSEGQTLHPADAQGAVAHRQQSECASEVATDTSAGMPAEVPSSDASPSRSQRSRSDAGRQQQRDRHMRRVQQLQHRVTEAAYATHPRTQEAPGVARPLDSRAVEAEDASLSFDGLLSRSGGTSSNRGSYATVVRRGPCHESLPG